ncbi:MAG TPA: hypothetical protein PKA93_00260, partial [Arachnia sp.]|nr:hypothetical protein [Arachnia sp.]
VLTLGLQLPVARWTARLGAPRALRLGYLAHVSAFLLLAVGAVASGPGSAALVLLAIAVTCIMLGHLVVNPTGLGLVPGFARGRATGVYFGLLATCGGIAVLLGNLVAGALIEAGLAAEAPPLAPLLPWLFLATLPLAAAVLVPRVLRASGVDR